VADRARVDYSNGTVIFVQKKAPGAEVGEGYDIEIYENAIKTQTVFRRTKKEVLDLIKKYKELYNTNRAFQNEIEVFVTFPTKEERGEPVSANIDSKIEKQANRIESLLIKLFNPEIPVINRSAEDLSNESLDQVLQQPSPSMTTTISNEEAADVIFQKMKQFILENKDKEVDFIYNKVKGWLFKVNDRLKMYNKMSEDSQLDPIEVRKLLSSKLSSDPEINEISQKIVSMSPGNIEGVNQNSPKSDTEENKAAGKDLSKEFWKYASEFDGVSTIDSVFVKWAKEKNIIIPDASATWKVVSNDIDSMFNTRSAAWGDYNILLSYLTNGFKKVYAASGGDINKLKTMYNDVLKIALEAINAYIGTAFNPPTEKILPNTQSGSGAFLNEMAGNAKLFYNAMYEAIVSVSNNKILAKELADSVDKTIVGSAKQIFNEAFKKVVETNPEAKKIYDIYLHKNKSSV